MTWDWTDLEYTTFFKAKQLVTQVQDLAATREGEPFDTAEPKVYGWSPWQRQDGMQVPVGFWSQLWKGIEIH
jgi:hypothetical protein